MLMIMTCKRERAASYASNLSQDDDCALDILRSSGLGADAVPCPRQKCSEKWLRHHGHGHGHGVFILATSSKGMIVKLVALGQGREALYAGCREGDDHGHGHGHGMSANKGDYKVKATCRDALQKLEAAGTSLKLEKKHQEDVVCLNLNRTLSTRVNCLELYQKA